MILPLEKQVTSLEISKRLKEVGSPQESLFYWEKNIFPHEDRYTLQQPKAFNDSDAHRYFSAYTVAEVQKLLPGRIRLEFEDVWLWITTGKDNEFSEVRYRGAGGMEYPSIPRVQEDGIADAPGKMLIYLYEKGLVKV